MSHPAINLSRKKDLPLGHHFIELKSVESTNKYAMAEVHAGVAFHGFAWFAHEQSAGKGQRGKSWVSSRGESIAMSIVVEPGFLRPTQQFLLSMTIAVACFDFLANYFPEGWSIKWPNDLYWRDRKAGGILIESICRGDDWLFAIVGIGININQSGFPQDLPNPVSLHQITGKTFNPTELARELCNSIDKKYASLKKSGAGPVIAAYNQSLFMLNRRVKLKKGNILFETTIRGVSPQGRLLGSDGEESSFDPGEVEWVLETPV